MRRFLKAGHLVVVIASCFIFPIAAHAVSYTYSFSGITSNSSTNIATGEDELSVVVSEYATSQIAFTFYNAAISSSSITGVYFDDVGILSGIIKIVESSGVDFSIVTDTSHSVLPGGNGQQYNFQVTSLATSDNPSVKNGVNASGEWVTIVFDFLKDVNGDYYNISDVISALSSEALRIGIHVQGFTNGGSESFLSDKTPTTGDNGGADPAEVVPEPGSLVLLGSVLLGIAGFRLKGKSGSK